MKTGKGEGGGREKEREEGVGVGASNWSFPEKTILKKPRHMSRKLPYKFPSDKLYRLIGSIKHPKQPKTREALVNIKFLQKFFTIKHISINCTSPNFISQIWTKIFNNNQKKKKAGICLGKTHTALEVFVNFFP